MGRPERRALIAVAAQFFVNGALAASFMGRAPQLRDQLGINVAAFGALLTVAALGGLAASLAAGRIVHRVGTFRVLVAGGVAMLVCLTAIGGAANPWAFLAALAVYQFADALVDITMNLQGSWLSAKRATGVMNRLHGVWSLGLLTGGLGAVAANAVGASPFTHIAFAAALAGLMLVLTARHLVKVDDDAHADAPQRHPAASPGARRSLLAVGLIVVAGMCAVIAELAGSDWATFRLTDDLGAAPALGSIAYVAFAVGMAAMRLVGDAAEVKVGRMGLHRVSLVVSAAGFVVAAFAPSAVWVVVGFVLIGVGVASFMPKLYDDAARLPGRRGAGLGAMTAGNRVAGLGTPAVVGGLAGAGSRDRGACRVTNGMDRSWGTQALRNVVRHDRPLAIVG